MPVFCLSGYKNKNFFCLSGYKNTPGQICWRLKEKALVRRNVL
ncbi:hypothetical protein LTSESEN_0934 [Salmonella enterica subsp. enterica serovar Senftenberg str. A4-543]|uniref:Uncharacterized protein n=1 Tax=Salmonella enterica subsp. enterica serovar Senftenberg str. A4-543 TaxID=913082 RepID=G5QW75_SALSE|nr:hypothetical protein LTSESEN_0934 [Salmonella enterica subsp. enterica serovar Senftenberg str. A4-543]